MADRLIHRVDSEIESSYKLALHEHTTEDLKAYRNELLSIFNVLMHYWNTLAENAALQYIEEYSHLSADVLQDQDHLLIYTYMSRQPELFPIA